MRLFFSKVQLGKGSYLRLGAVRDGDEFDHFGFVLTRILTRTTNVGEK